MKTTRPTNCPLCKVCTLRLDKHLKVIKKCKWEYGKSFVRKWIDK